MEIMVMRQNGMKRREIGEYLEISENTVATYIKRALVNLRHRHGMSQ